MQVFTKQENLRRFLDEFPGGTRTGFVPTMGALHRGHLSLVEHAVRHTDVCVVSIFVNPTQFDNPEDLKKYPSSLRRDLEMLEVAGCRAVYLPDAADLYGDRVEREHFDFHGLDTVMEGAHRPGHFDGVWTVVRLLFQIVRPDNAYFGEKDFQQLQIIRRKTSDEGLPVHITGLPIVREPDGLALSSRNRRLTPEYRKAAPFIYRTLQQAREKFGTKTVKEISEWVQSEFKKNRLLKLEYFTVADEKNLTRAEEILSGRLYRAFIAVYAGDIRLIDNIPLYN